MANSKYKTWTYQYNVDISREFGLVHRLWTCQNVELIKICLLVQKMRLFHRKFTNPQSSYTIYALF